MKKKKMKIDFSFWGDYFALSTFVFEPTQGGWNEFFFWEGLIIKQILELQIR